MRQKLKHSLSRTGMMPYISLVRETAIIARWLSNGASGATPSTVKHWIISSYLRRFDLRSFVETGTLHGDTLAIVANRRDCNCVSVELSEAHFEAAKRRFCGFSNVRLIYGDSGEVMPKIVSELEFPTLFWLDGHYSGGTTANGVLQTPVSSELRAILASHATGHVVLIDDVRCFDGTNDYPHIDELLRDIRKDGRYSAEIAADVLRLTPRPAS